MFELVSEYKPTGDQPQAIDYLVKGIFVSYYEQISNPVLFSIV